MGGGLDSRCVGGVYGANGARHHPHRTHHLHSGSQDHHPSKNSVHKVMVNSNELITTTEYMTV